MNKTKVIARKNDVPMPEVARPILKEANLIRQKIIYELRVSPSLISMIKSIVPEDALLAVLTTDQKQRIAKGALKIMVGKNGMLRAKLVNPKTGRIVTDLPMKAVRFTPELSRAITDFSMHIQLAQIAEQVEIVQLAIEEIRVGQENDRLASAYSCRQRLVQSLKIQDPALKASALIQLVAASEDSRNKLMLSQKETISFLIGQPESFFQKIIRGDKPEKIEERIREIRESLYAVNEVSIVAAIAYYELGERQAAKKSLSYYVSFIDDTYVSNPQLLQRLDSIDPSPSNYWSESVPLISTKINSMLSHKLPNIKNERRRLCLKLTDNT